MTTEEWYDGKWNDWCWKMEFFEFIEAPGTMNGVRLDQIRICHNGTRPLTSPAMIHGSVVTDEVIPTSDGTDFRQCERRVDLFVL